ncbi:MAG: HDIG domain-containing protein [Opitutaceae bacterium]
MATIEKTIKPTSRLRGRKRRRRTGSASGLFDFLEHSLVVSVIVFLLTVFSIVFISFVGVTPAGYQILPNQLASVRIIADAPFSYESALLTERNRQRMESQIPPVYRIDMDPYRKFETDLHDLLAETEVVAAGWSGESDEERTEQLSALAEVYNVRGGYRMTANDLATLMQYGDPEGRIRLLDTGLYILQEIYRAGVFDSRNSVAAAAPNTVPSFQILNDSGQARQARPQPLDDAQTFLRINLAAENIPPAIATAVFRLLRNGLVANLKFDPEASKELRETALNTLEPEVVVVEPGRSIIEPGTRVTPEQHEMLVAYQRFLSTSRQLPSGIDIQLVSRMILVLAMILTAVGYIRLEDPLTLQSNGRLSLLALVLVLNLGLVRASYEMATLPFFVGNPSASAILPYLAPTAFAPIIVATLIGGGPGLFSALLVSLFTGVMYGNRLDILVVSFLSSTVAILSSRNARFRGRIVRAGGYAGMAGAFFALLIGLADQITLNTIWRQMGAALGTGVFTGIVVVGLIPILESLFKRTTDITLIELADFNHPLLRRMQMEAPGTYHHSLMVATLSENAANAIGGNALLCRVGCMFHDIGKMVKPEYFTENQGEAGNPHDEKSPSFSALIIKSHVKEGVDMGVKNKLPRPIIDIIRQHHGTSLIWYFYHRALEAARATAGSEGGSNGSASSVSESTYRYDGPKPQFLESAIVFFADSVEAASRSLRKVTPQNIEELVDSIFDDRIRDGQLDECPITYAQVGAIKRSFNFTLLNSLHARIAYPKADKGGDQSTRNEPETAVSTPA